MSKEKPYIPSKDELGNADKMMSRRDAVSSNTRSEFYEARKEKGLNQDFSYEERRLSPDRTEIEIADKSHKISIKLGRTEENPRDGHIADGSDLIAVGGKVDHFVLTAKEAGEIYNKYKNMSHLSSENEASIVEDFEGNHDKQKEKVLSEILGKENTNEENVVEELKRVREGLKKI